MSIATAGYTINDALVKTLSDAMSMGQVMLLRGIFATMLLALLAWRSGTFTHLGRLRQKSVLIRVLCEAGATTCFLVALFRLPIANVTAILQVLPLSVTMGAAFVFSEPVGWRRWCAIAAGLVGVLIIVRPGFEAFSAWSLFALACVGFSTMRDLATRRISPDTPTVLVSTITALAVTLCGAGLFQPLGGWEPVTLPAISVLLGAALALVFGYQFVIAALREGEISFMAPFRYTGLLWALALGYLIFGDVPDAAMLLGAAIVVASGLYALYRERIVARKQPISESTGPGMAPTGT